jgi:hypothetical protein
MIWRKPATNNHTIFTFKKCRFKPAFFMPGILTKRLLNKLFLRSIEI